MKVEELAKLYRLYGFEKEYVSKTESYIVFSYHLGFFNNIEFVQLKNDKETDCEIIAMKKEYEKIGYNSIAVHSYGSLYEAEKSLFQAFFYPEENKKRLKQEYYSFCQRQNEKLQGKFEYIAGSFQDSSSSIKKDLVTYIVETRKITNARLTIMEAAAGYGKTCTVYEIINSLLSSEKVQVPLFVELSKNRNARLFRYVLQDEIDKKFTQLSSAVVIREIKTGRIPLIIDGFDELIEQKGTILDDSDERSLSMLSTIADLLGDDSNAWILLTTRNRAIFSGDLFEEWVMSKLGRGCIVDRLRILKPSVQEWLGNSIYKTIQEKGINIEGMANPVLLTFLRNMDVSQLAIQLNSQDSVLNQYLSLLLNRDREQLDLLLEEEEQYIILEKLAGNFVQYDITSDTNEFIQDILKDILEDKFPELLGRYHQSGEVDPVIQTSQEYVQRLSHSCLLDRISLFQNQYGFINEFVLGIMAGDAVRNDYLLPEEISERYLDIMTTAYEGRDEVIRLALYEKIHPVLKDVTSICRLNVECALLHCPNSNYENQYFQSLIFSEYISFKNENVFEECIFDNCLFECCNINASAFLKCRFYNCQFYNILVEGKPDEELIFINCIGESGLYAEHKVPVLVDVGEDYEKVVLEQFWKPGYSSAELRRTYTALFKGVNPQKHMNIQKAIESLLRKGFIRELNICYELNTNCIGEIKHILGR